MKHYLIHGDSAKVLKNLPENSIDCVVTDPPYGLSFMGKSWDYQVPNVDIWREVIRVLKPGGHLLCFSGTRTYHRMVVNIEDAGFEVRDMIAWLYGSGFPKGQDLGKAIDKALGKERKVIGKRVHPTLVNNPKVKSRAFHVESLNSDKNMESWGITAPASSEAAMWAGWNNALKPALEPIVVARKPFTGTLVNNVLKHGTGAINVDDCRVATNPDVDDPRLGGNGAWTTTKEQTIYGGGRGIPRGTVQSSAKGRYPANLIHDGSDEVTSAFPTSKDGNYVGRNRDATKHSGNKILGARNADTKDVGFGGEGSAARFFYCAKCNKKDRGVGNSHPTVKPTELMRYLVRLVCRKGGTVLDPFAGSGSTGKAAFLEGANSVLVERDKGYSTVALARVPGCRRLKSTRVGKRLAKRLSSAAKYLIQSPSNND